MLRAMIIAAALSTVAVASIAQPAGHPAQGASARKEWREHHPRRAEVNDRLANQNRRIKDEVAEGDMSKAKAAQLRKEDRQIRQEERDMAAQNGGHITKAEQRVLNQQENQVSKQIGK